MRGCLVCITVLILAVMGWAQPGQVWHHTYGGTGWDEGRTIDPATNGGYVVAGNTSSFGHSDGDFYLVRIDEDGNELWHQTYGGSGSEGYEWVEVQRAWDGGYFLAGETSSFGAGSYDFYAVKTDSGGNVLWTRTYGGAGVERTRDAIQMKDGGYAIVGYSCTFASGYADFYVVRTDAMGIPIWTRNYGGTGVEDAHSVVETFDHGLLIAGYTTSYGAGQADIYLVRTDDQGNVLWTRTYGGTQNETIAEYVRIRHAAGGYVMATFTRSSGAGLYDAYVVRLDYDGNVIWSRTYGSPQNDDARDIVPTDDGGFVLGGYSYANDALGDYYLVKINDGGDELWSMRFGGPGTQWIYSVQEAPDGAILAVGKAANGSHGGWDMSVFRIESQTLPPPDFEEPDSTDYPYPIIVDNAVIDDQPLVAGDMIGVFDRTTCVGRATVTTFPLTITTWGTDSIHGLPGFLFGDSILFRVWSRAANLALPATPTFIYGDGTFGFPDHSEVTLSAITDFTLEIPLRANYAELVSLNLQPQNCDPDTIFRTVNQLAAVYDNLERYYIPGGGNTIETVQVNEGYRVISTRADTLVVHGRRLNPNPTYALYPNWWNWLGYPLRTARPIEAALNSIRADVRIVMNSNGEVWIPSLGINTLQEMEPGQGYMIWTTSNLQFTYPDHLTVMSVPPENRHRNPVVPAPARPNGVPYAVLVHFSDEVRQMNPALVEIYDGNLCVGHATPDLNHNVAVVTAWQAWAQYGFIGFTPGNVATVRIYDAAHQRINVHETSASAIFGTGPFAEVTVDIVSQSPAPFTVREVSPNPFNSAVNLSFVLGESGPVEFRVFNTLGQLVYEVKRTFDAGENRFTLNSRDFPTAPVSGMYFVELKHRGERQLRKILLIR